MTNKKPKSFLDLKSYYMQYRFARSNIQHINQPDSALIWDRVRKERRG
ncbi:MAG: hypothetical protein ACYTFW_16915 [Planctomycetota bacterium]|jgi:hypothetical protein